MMLMNIPLYLLAYMAQPAIAAAAQPFAQVKEEHSLEIQYYLIGVEIGVKAMGCMILIFSMLFLIVGVLAKLLLKIEKALELSFEDSNRHCLLQK